LLSAFRSFQAHCQAIQPEDARVAALLFVLSAHLLDSHYIACNMAYYQ